MIPAAVESGALWMHLLQTMVQMSQNWWMIQSRGYWTAACSAFPSMVCMSRQYSAEGCSAKM
eukprot:640942-Rhodomonas_salina.1